MKSIEQIDTIKTGTLLVLGVTATLLSLAALNGGTAVTASDWDSVVTYLRNMLTSTWVLVLGLVALVVCVWQLAHGQGYGAASYVLAIMGFAIIGPGVVTAMATSIGEIGYIHTSPPIQSIR